MEEEGILDAPEFVRQFSFPVTIICYYDIVDSLNAQQAALNETFHADNEDDQVPNNDNEREKVSQNSSGNEDDSSNSTGDKGQTDVSERKTIENSQQVMIIYRNFKKMEHSNLRYDHSAQEKRTIGSEKQCITIFAHLVYKSRR